MKKSNTIVQQTRVQRKAADDVRVDKGHDALCCVTLDSQHTERANVKEGITVLQQIRVQVGVVTLTDACDN